ncbi:MAG TPA: DNA/RNA non-specific endonuclease, partial [Gemmatimonadaceae bacterium]|nr:DNA/RNA non-specific endonuclease [Gemmatimonadaceae bacterium]
MRLRIWGAALIALALTANSCSENGVVGPDSIRATGLQPSAVVGSSVVISQVYGGGGNVGSTYTNDFIELHNRGTTDVSVTGWSVQYMSAGSAANFQVTPLTGTIRGGGYLLVQEAKGNAGSIPLDAEVLGTIAMSASDGKVALVNSTAAISLTCATGVLPCVASAPGSVLDAVGFGSANFFEGTAVGTLSATKAALRTGDGCDDTDKNGADFQVLAPAPRNRLTPAKTCDVTPARTIDHIVVSPARGTVVQGATQAFTAAAFDAGNAPISGVSFTWSTNPNPSSVASIAQTGIATAADAGDVTIIATSGSVSGSAVLHVDPTPPPALPAIRFSELHYDNAGDDNDEQIEIEGPAGADLSGWSVALYDGGSAHLYTTKALTGIIPASCGDRGVVVVPFDQIQNGPNDGFALVHGSEVVEFFSYEGSITPTDGPAIGLTSTDIGQSEASNSPVLSSLHRNALGAWTAPARRSFGRCNASNAHQGAPDFDISFSGRLRLTDPPLPIGFEDQLFATELDLNDAEVRTSFTWTAETPAVATIDERGVMHALAAGTAVFRATSQDGTSVTYALPTTNPEFSATANYHGNTEFGVPMDADASDDQLVVHPEFTASYNKNRGTPNWVSWLLEASHFGDGSVDRCDCFTHDPLLPTNFTHLNTADYTGAGTAAGYGIDRGHLARSFDFTAAPGDNSIVYLLSNIVPQASDMNQGPWANQELFLGNIARSTFNPRDIYTIAGVAGSKGTVKGEGKITIPASTWKVSVIVPHGTGLAEVHTYQDLEVIAVNMPNVPGIRGVDWHTYETTVDAIEALTGYDLLALLPDNVERAVESNTKPPIAATNGPYQVAEGSSLSVSGAKSVDLNGTIAGYSWDFGDGASAQGVSPVHTYSQDGDYIVQLIARDNDGLADTTTT